MKKGIVALLICIVLTAPVFATDYTSPETIKQVQEALNAAGYNCGAPDGVAGNGTKGQIEKYRADNGLSAGSEIDAELCQKLGLEETGVLAEENQNSASLHLESEYGIIDLVRYELNDNVLSLVFDYTNTTDETTAPVYKYIINVFQNGKEIDTSFSAKKPDDCDNIITQIRPGATVRYAQSYTLTDLSSVEVEVSAVFDFSKSIKNMVVIDFGNTNIVEEKPAPTTEVSSSTELETKLTEANKRIAELENQLSEANSKVSELEGQLAAIKAALGN